MKSVVGLYENRQAVGGATDPQLHSNRTVIHFKREYLVQLYYTRGRRRQTHPGHPKGCVPLKGGKDPRQRVGGSVQGKETYTHPPAKAPRRITIRISIYAPPCGGRPCWDAVIRSVSEFQFTPPYGGDRCSSGFRRSSLYFNPRPHTGATRQDGFWRCCRRDFNPRPHTGATAPYVPYYNGNKISIHAPIRGRQFFRPVP